MPWPLCPHWEATAPRKSLWFSSRLLSVSCRSSSTPPGFGGRPFGCGAGRRWSGGRHQAPHHPAARRGCEGRDCGPPPGHIVAHLSSSCCRDPGSVGLLEPVPGRRQGGDAGHPPGPAARIALTSHTPAQGPRCRTRTGVADVQRTDASSAGSSSASGDSSADAEVSSRASRSAAMWASRPCPDAQSVGGHVQMGPEDADGTRGAQFRCPCAEGRAQGVGPFGPAGVALPQGLGQGGGERSRARSWFPASSVSAQDLFRGSVDGGALGLRPSQPHVSLRREEVELAHG